MGTGPMGPNILYRNGHTGQIETEKGTRTDFILLVQFPCACPVPDFSTTQIPTPVASV